jgi:hypothetical protein
MSTPVAHPTKRASPQPSLSVRSVHLWRTSRVSVELIRPTGSHNLRGFWVITPSVNHNQEHSYHEAHDKLLACCGAAASYLTTLHLVHPYTSPTPWKVPLPRRDIQEAAYPFHCPTCINAVHPTLRRGWSSGRWDAWVAVRWIAHFRRSTCRERSGSELHRCEPGSLPIMFVNNPHGLDTLPDHSCGPCSGAPFHVPKLTGAVIGSPGVTTPGWRVRPLAGRQDRTSG